MNGEPYNSIGPTYPHQSHFNGLATSINLALLFYFIYWIHIIITIALLQFNNNFLINLLNFIGGDFLHNIYHNFYEKIQSKFVI